jgi:acyl-CoA synthetase (AMP-forming)/AMP-acid ligase II
MRTTGPEESHALRADKRFRSIPGMVRTNAARFADHVAIVDGEQRITYAELEQQMLSAARATMALGVKPGDRVALWAPNSAKWVAAALGMLATGAWLVPVNTRFKGDEAAYVLDKSDAAALLTVSDFLGTDYPSMLRRAAPGVRALSHTIILDGPVSAGAVGWDDFLTGGEVVPADAAAARIDEIDPDAVSDVMFTSGTTARPKGAMLTHASSLRCYEAWNQGFGLAEGDRMIVLNPFFHCFGYKAGWMLSLMVGATVYPMAVLEPRRLLELISSEGITMLPGPPTLFTEILDYPERERFDLSTLRVAFVGASTVPAELIYRLQRELPFKSITTGYGLTEATAMVANSAPGDDPDMAAQWSGQIIPGVEVRVVDNAGRVVPPGEEGEILVRGFNIMKGYLDDPVATEQAVDREGWLHTGDIGFVNEQQYIKITDRKKDIFICGGFNVSPAEVENALMGLDTVQQVAVVGKPDRRLGEVGVAFVIPRPGASIDPEEVIGFARQRLANYKVPREVRLVDALPLNASGKVLKTQLRQHLS